MNHRAEKCLDTQGMFEKVWRHFVTNNAPMCTDSYGHPCYHFEDEQRGELDCPIGLFDEEHLLVGDYARVCTADLLETSPEVFARVFGTADLAPEDQDFVSDMQSIHDVACSDPDEDGEWVPFHESITYQLRSFADLYGLHLPA